MLINSTIKLNNCPQENYIKDQILWINSMLSNNVVFHLDKIIMFILHKYLKLLPLIINAVILDSGVKYLDIMTIILFKEPVRKNI